MNPNSIELLSYACPELSRRVILLAGYLQKNSNLTIDVSQVFRSWNAQDDLYAKGRTAPGPKVTNAPGGYSNHNFGWAADVYPRDAHNQPDWNPNHQDWQTIVAAAPLFGLRDGLSWGDEPHLEAIEMPAKPDDETRQLFKDGGCLGLWKVKPLPVFSCPT
jgi:D-alanyl-D-alanine carboxypeptidase